MKNPSAFPRAAGNTGPCDAPSYNTAQGGMTLRDYFAAKAMQGSIASMNDDRLYNTDECIRRDAKKYYRMADAMLKAREE